jgi:hypothetical protein
MTSAELLVDMFERIREDVHGAVRGLTPDQIALRIDADANSIAWLVWHLTRIQDDHVAAAAHVEQVWTSAGWIERFGLPFEPWATGYAHSSADVAAVTVDSGDVLLDYHDAVHAQTIRFDARRPARERDQRQHRACRTSCVRARDRPSQIGVLAARG